MSNDRGRGPDDIGGLGEEKPGDIQQEDDEFDLYRKRMMLAYRFRPNPLVRHCFFFSFAMSVQFFRRPNSISYIYSCPLSVFNRAGIPW